MFTIQTFNGAVSCVILCVASSQTPLHVWAGHAEQLSLCAQVLIALWFGGPWFREEIMRHAVHGVALALAETLQVLSSHFAWPAPRTAHQRGPARASERG